MRQLSFKRGLYRFYSPYLYKLYRLKARFDLWRWNIDASELDALSNAYWKKYLSQKMTEEAPYFNCLPYSAFKMPDKKGERVYILGSGTSINDVTEAEWQEIDKYFSIGLNLFYAHSFTPDMYFTEFRDFPSFMRLINEQAVQRQTEKDFALMISSKYISRSDENSLSVAAKKPYFYSTMAIKTQCKALLEMLTKGYFTQNSDSVFLHQISNLDAVINFCVLQGFKDIRLVGVDLYDTRYFFEENGSDNAEYELAREALSELGHSHMKDKKTSKEHATAAKDVSDDLGNFPITEYLPLLQKWVLDDIGVELAVCNPKSLLSDSLGYKPIL